jgi:hypothetical protein
MVLISPGFDFPKLASFFLPEVGPSAGKIFEIPLRLCLEDRRF